MGPKNGGDEDDDFVVDFAPDVNGDDDFRLPEDNSVADFEPDGLVAPALPEGVEEGVEPAAGAAPQPGAGAEPEGDDEIMEVRRQAQEAEERARRTEASALIKEAQYQAQLAETNRNSTKLALDTLDIRMRDARMQLAAAREEGNTRAEVEIETAIRQMEQVRTEIEAARARLPDPRAIIAQAEAQARQILSTPRGTQVGGIRVQNNPLAERWALSNKWLQDPKHKDASDTLLQISGTLVREGWDPKSREYYAELTNRMAKKFPNLGVRGLQAPKAGAAKPAVRTPVAPGRSQAVVTNPAPQLNARRYTLRQDDIAAMRRMNLDPNNKEHRKYFAKSRIETARREAMAQQQR